MNSLSRWVLIVVVVAFVVGLVAFARDDGPRRIGSISNGGAVALNAPGGPDG